MRVLERLDRLYAIGGGPGANRLGGTHEEQRVDAGEGRAHGVRLVVARDRDLRSGQVRRSRGIAHHQALRHALPGQQGGDPPADRAGRAGDPDQSSCRHAATPPRRW